MWRMLPGRVYVARGYLPPGEHRISINGRLIDQPIQIDGQYALVPLRIYHNSVLTGQVATIGQLAAQAAVPAPQSLPWWKPPNRKNAGASRRPPVPAPGHRPAAQ